MAQPVVTRHVFKIHVSTVAYKVMQKSYFFMALYLQYGNDATFDDFCYMLQLLVWELKPPLIQHHDINSCRCICKKRETKYPQL